MGVKSLIRMRMSCHDAHYGGNLVDGAKMLQLFGDVATELLIINDGDEGLFKARWATPPARWSSRPAR